MRLDPLKTLTVSRLPWVLPWALGVAWSIGWAQPKAAEASAPRPIVVGVMAELTGAGASYSLDMVRGAEMAVEEINRQGGIRGRPLQLRVADGGTLPARSAISMRRLAVSDAVAVVGGWGSAQVLANLEVAEQDGFPYVVVGATSPAITSVRNQWTLRVSQNDAKQANSLAAAVLGPIGATSIAVIADSSAYGLGNRDAFVAALRRARVEPVAQQTYEPDALRFTAQLSAIAQAKPQVLAVFGTLPAAALLMKQARDLGINARFVGTGGTSNDGLPAAAQGAAEGLLVSAIFDENADAESKAWSERYRARHAGDAQAPRPQQAAWQYRVIRYMLAPCLKAVPPDDRVALRDCLRAWKGSLFGLSGELRFDETGQLVAPTVMLQVQQGRYVAWPGRGERG